MRKRFAWEAAAAAAARRLRNARVGRFEAEIDTARVRELKGDALSLEAEAAPSPEDRGLSLEDTRPMVRPHFAPYGEAGAPHRFTA